MRESAKTSSRAFFLLKPRNASGTRRSALLSLAARVGHAPAHAPRMLDPGAKAPVADVVGVWMYGTGGATLAVGAAVYVTQGYGSGVGVCNPTFS